MKNLLNKVSVGLIQMKCSANTEDNLARAIKKCRQAAQQGAQMVCLQELFRSLYFCQKEDHAAFDLAEPIPGPTVEALSKTAKELGIVIIAGLFEKRAQGLYHNTAVVLDADGALAGTYRKMHIPDDPSFHEKFYFTPGDLGFRVFDTKFGRIGVLICWDQWYPEAARLTALQGAQILFYPTAIGWIPEDDPQARPVQHNAWETMQRSHAIANGVFVAAPNRVGTEGNTQFWGQSFICSPFGDKLATASSDKEEVLVAVCDFAQIEEMRRQWPFLRDRRIDAYGGIVNRYSP